MTPEEEREGPTQSCPKPVKVIDNYSQVVSGCGPKRLVAILPTGENHVIYKKFDTPLFYSNEHIF